MSKTVAATVEAVAALQPVDPRKDISGNILSTEGATTPAVAQALKIDRSAARRRLQAAEDRELIVNLEKRPRAYRPSYYRTLAGHSRRWRLSAERRRTEKDLCDRPRGKMTCPDAQKRFLVCGSKGKFLGRLLENGQLSNPLPRSKSMKNKEKDLFWTFGQANRGRSEEQSQMTDDHANQPDLSEWPIPKCGVGRSAMLGAPRPARSFALEFVASELAQTFQNRGRNRCRSRRLAERVKADEPPAQPDLPAQLPSAALAHHRRGFGSSAENQTAATAGRARAGHRHGQAGSRINHASDQ